MALRTITINNFSLQDTNFKTKDILFHQQPSKVIDIEENVRRDGYRVKNTYYTDKQITVRGQIICSSATDLETKIHNMKEALHGTDLNVDIVENSNTYRYIGTVSSISIPEEHFHVSNVPFDISIKCKPFGTSTSQSTYSITYTTDTNSTFNPTGSYGPEPTIRFTCSGTPTTAIRSITFSNSTTTDIITISSLSIDANGDYVEIDCNDLTVQASYDGGAASDIDFTGVIPKFNAGTNSWSVAITCSNAYTIKQEINYYPTYL